MMELNKILWPNNFSETALQALPYIKALMEKYGSEIHLLYVAQDLANYGHYWGEPDPKHVRGLHEFALKGAQKSLEKFCSHEFVSCPAYSIHVALGDPVKEILKAIDQIGTDLVVMSVHGLQEEFHSGSITQKVIQYSPVPVLTVNPPVKS